MLFELTEPQELVGLLGWVLLPPLREFLKNVGLETNFGFFLFGKSGLWKTTIARLFLCLYGAGWLKANLTGLLTNTTNFLLSLGFHFKDLPLLFDDAYPPKTPEEGKHLNEILNLIYRFSGNATYKGRLRSDGSFQMAKTFDAVPLVTGEVVPQFLLSSLARCIFIKAFPKNLKVLTRLQETPEALNALGSLWISFLGKKNEEIKKLARERKRELIDNRFFTKLSTIHPRVALNFWTLIFTLEVFKLFTEEELKVPWRWESLIQKGLDELVMEAVNLWIGLNPLESFRFGLRELLDAGQVIVAEKPEDFEEGKAIIGFIKGEIFYLFPQIALSLWLKHFSKNTGVLIPDTKYLYQLLTEEGWVKDPQCKPVRFGEIVKRSLPLALNFLNLEEKK